MTIRCSRCQHENPLQSKFCLECGAQLGLHCPACGGELPENAKFCNECGSSIAPSVSPGPAPYGAPGSYTPRYLAEKILTSRSALEGERKLVTVLFCDIVNSTSLAEQLGAETMHRLLDRFFELALHDIHRYGGTVNQFLGDGFMALFGAPVAHEDHARRAAHAALALEETFKTDLQGVRLQLRIGLNTGSVIVGKIGDNLRMDYTAVGDTTNLAARLEHAAVPGEIYLGQNTYAAIRQYFECNSLGERKVKGKARRVAVYSLRGLRAAGAPHQDSPLHSPMVGREREYATLEAALRRLHSGLGSIVGIVGEAGAGKSRLVSEVRRAEHSGLLWPEAHALSFGQTIPYGPFIDILRHLAGITQRDTHEEVWEKLRIWIDVIAGSEGREHMPYIGTLLGCELPSELSTLVGRLDANDLRGQIYISTRRLVEKLAGHGPTVLELDDWHWADDASASLVEHLLPLTERSPLLILFAGRPEAGTPCARLRSQASQHHAQLYVEILLGPLSSSDSNEVIDNLIPLAELSPQLRGMILERAGGNPLFLEEVIHSLLSSGVLRRDAFAGTLHEVVRAEEIALPDRIEGVLMARIDRLEEDVKQVLKLAAVIGRSFYRRLLQALDEAEHHLDDCLGQLQQLELIRQKQALPELEYMFRHALVQEASYASILAERRRKLHAQVGKAIERLFADRLDEFAGFLAYHFARAEDWENAQKYLFRAGDQAVRMAADVEAMTHYQKAVDAYSRIYGERWDPLQRASLARKMGEALFRLGKDEQAAEQFSEALACLGTSYPRSRSGVQVRILRELLVQVSHRLGFGKPAAAGTAGQADEEELRVYVCLSLLDYYGDPQRFFLDVLAGLNWAERMGLMSGVAQGSTGMAVIWDALGLRAWAGNYSQRAAEFARRSGDQRAHALSLFGSAFHSFYIGNWSSAVELFSQANEAWEGIGAIRELGMSIGTLVWLVQWQGDLPILRPMLAKLARLGEESGDRHVSTWATHFASTQLAREGRLDEAVAMMRRTIESLKAIPDYPALVEAFGRLADCYLRQGKVEEACAAADEADRWSASKRVSGHLAFMYPQFARIWALLARAEQSAEPRRRELLREAREASRRAMRTRRIFAAALPQTLCALGSAAQLSGRGAVARKTWRRSLGLASKLGATYDLALTHREIGRLTADATELETALDLFRQTGAAFDVARTLRHLGELGALHKSQSASAWFEECLEMHRSMSAEHELALTHAAYARLCRALGREADGLYHAREALALLDRCGRDADRSRVEAELIRRVT